MCRWLVLTPVDREDKNGGHHDELHMHEFDGMDSCHGEGGRLFVSVMQLVEILVKERRVVDPVMPVG